MGWGGGGFTRPTRVAHEIFSKGEMQQSILKFATATLCTFYRLREIVALFVNLYFLELTC